MSDPAARCRWTAPFLLALGLVAWIELSDVWGVLSDRAGTTTLGWIRLGSTYALLVAVLLWQWERLWPILRSTRFVLSFLLLGAMAWFGSLLLELPMSLLGLGRGDATLAPAEARRLREPLPRDAAPAALGERLGFQPQAAGLDRREAFTFTLPDTWVEQPATEMRWINLRAGDAECWVLMLPGGGDLLANVNRWRGQLGQPPLDDAGLAALPRRPVFGIPAVLVEGRGTYEGRPEQALLGLMAPNSGGMLAVKMVGPVATVARERERFFAFAGSLAPSAKLRALAGTGPEAAAGTASGWTWSVPAGWRVGPARDMREATFFAGPADAVECWISVLSGDAGGMLANVNRWRGEVGLPPVSRLDEQPRESVPMLGTEALFVTLSGTWTGRGSRIEDATLLAVACPLSDRVLFVKMVGPRAAVDGERARFLELVRSLRSGT
jgi:hypothetical protein